MGACHFLIIFSILHTYLVFYVLLTVNLGTIFVNNQREAQFFLYMFISILYMFQAAMCPSSGELIVSIWNLVYVTPYRWPFGAQVWMSLIQTCTLNTEWHILDAFGMSVIPNSATDIHQLGPNNICGHNTKLTTPMYFNWLF